MAVYSSGSIRFNGLGNDTNFDEMIEKLYKIESKQVTRLMNWQKDWQTRLDGFGEIRDALKTFQTACMGLNNMTKFMSKTTKSTKEEYVSASADWDCIDGANTVEVKRLATTSSWAQKTGLYNKTETICQGVEDPPGSGVYKNGTFKYSYKGKMRELSIPPGTTVEGLVRLINNDSKNPGIVASLLSGKDGITLDISGKDTGSGSSLVIRETTGLILSTSLGDPSTFPYNDENENLKIFNTPIDSTQKLYDLFPPEPLKDENGDPIVDPNDPPNYLKPDYQTFVYSVDGQRRTVKIEKDWTVLDLQDAINNAPGGANQAWSGDPVKHPALCQLDDLGGGMVQFRLQKNPTEYTITSSGGGKTAADQAAAQSKWVALWSKDWTNVNEKVNPDGQPYEININITPSDANPMAPVTLKITKDMTVNDVKNALQSKLGSTGKVHLDPVWENGNIKGYNFRIEELEKDHRVDVENGTFEGLAYNIPRDDTNWEIVEGEDSQFKINGKPPGKDEWYESGSNTLKAGEFIHGLTLHLHDVGKATITTSTDTGVIQENVETFVDAYNAFIAKFQELTSVNDKKQVADPDFASSQFDMQQGSILTGNYGMQLLSSKLKMGVAGRARGFLPLSYAETGEFLGGDYFSSLSQIGLLTNAEKGNALYGMLEINLIPGFKGAKALDEAIKEDPIAVAKLFAATNMAESNSAHFQYAHSISGITQSGSYDVSYDIDASGNIVNAKIGGYAVPDKYINQQTKQITADEGPAKGLIIDVRTIPPLGTAQTYEGIVSIKEGKIPELLNLMGGSDGLLGANGALAHLENNYKDIIKNLEAKIQKEDQRLNKWETRMINKFARLDAVLANYNAINDGLKSQIAQLSAK